MTITQETVLVAGVGMIPFTKPGDNLPYLEMGCAAARAALDDARLSYAAVQQAYVGYVYGDSTCGQSALYPLGLTGVPVINVNNNCSTGSTALFLARQAIESGMLECVLAVGFEQMMPGALRSVYPDRPTPLERHIQGLHASQGIKENVPVAAQFFAAAGREYRDRYGTSDRTFAKIAAKSRKHAAANPSAVFRTPLTVEEILASPRVADPLTRLQCCPPTCGAAAAVLCSSRFARLHSIEPRVAIVAQAMTTDTAETFASRSMMALAGYDMSRLAADRVYEQSGIDPRDIPVVELHDCFTSNELITYEALRLTPEGTAEKFIEDGGNTYGGRHVVNPSGGLLSKGHPLGATGLAQATELVLQLRGKAGQRQVEGAKLALQHNIGLGGACVVTLYGRLDR